jgi:hypothetical protein
MQRSDYRERQRRIPEEGNLSLENIPEQISEEYFGISEAEA